jgi:hypothetical protein
MAVIRANEGRGRGAIQVKRDAQEGCDIGVLERAPHLALPDEFLITPSAIF